jgi:hypothetical protein
VGNYTEGWPLTLANMEGGEDLEVVLLSDAERLRKERDEARRREEIANKYAEEWKRAALDRKGEPCVECGESIPFDHVPASEVKDRCSTCGSPTHIEVPIDREGEGKPRLYCSVCGEYREDEYTCRKGGKSIPLDREGEDG